MITVKMTDEDFAEKLIDRVSYWTTDEDVAALFKEYYTNCAENGYFDGLELEDDLDYEVMKIVDNDYINYTSVVTAEEFEDHGIEDEDDEQILASIVAKDGITIYLISA